MAAATFATFTLPATGALGRRKMRLRFRFTPRRCLWYHARRLAIVGLMVRRMMAARWRNRFRRSRWRPH